MRGRRVRSSSAVSQGQPSMALRRKIIKNATDSQSGSQQSDGNSQEEDEAPAHTDQNDDRSSAPLMPSSSRQRCRKERENNTESKEMTEEEMMDLALRLSEQEASNTALRLQKEEEAMMKAIHESMVDQTQSCPASQSQSLLDDAESPHKTYSRRRLLYSNGEAGTSEQGCTAETGLDRGAKRIGDEIDNRSKKRKRKEGSPLLEMPDLSQTQKISSQASTCSSEILDLHLDSSLSSDCTQIDDSQPPKSPVFTARDCRVEVSVRPLSHNTLKTCYNSGFVLCSEDSQTSLPKSLQTKSQTFPDSPKRPSDLTPLSKSPTCPKSPVFSKMDQGEGGEMEYSPSPVFGRNTQHEKSPSACKTQVSKSEFLFSSQESLTSTVRSTSCRPESPVFPTSPRFPGENPAPAEKSAACRVSPALSESDGEQTEQKLSQTGRKVKVQGSGTDPHQHSRVKEESKSDDREEEPKKMSKDQDSSKTNDGTQLWLDGDDEDDEDVMVVGWISPVFPEEKPGHLVDARAASSSLKTSGSGDTTKSKSSLVRPSSSSSSSASSSRPQPSTTEQEQRPISCQETTHRTPAPHREEASGSTVHYYWGVPFCPRGLDPDQYTQVILAQMEVYEKSLKEAQRCLLRKAEWGEAILPQPERSPEWPAVSPRRPTTQRTRLRRKKRQDAADASPTVVEEEKEEVRGGEEDDNLAEREKREETQEDGKGESQEEPDDCEVCPETQLSDNNEDCTQDLTMDTEEEQPKPKTPEQPDVQMIVSDDSSPENELPEMEVDVVRKVNRGIPRHHPRKVQVMKEEEEREDSDVEEIGRSPAPGAERAVVPQNSTVDCPICQGSFSVAEIEVHAAYCDGEVDQRRLEADYLPVSPRPRRRRGWRDEGVTETNIGGQEKCYLCHKLVPLRNYSTHVDLCISRTETPARENLLSALDRAESGDPQAGPSGSRLQPGFDTSYRFNGLEEDDDEEEEDALSVIQISNPPNRFFLRSKRPPGALSYTNNKNNNNNNSDPRS